MKERDGAPRDLVVCGGHSASEMTVSCFEHRSFWTSASQPVDHLLLSVAGLPGHNTCAEHVREQRPGPEEEERKDLLS